MALTSSLAADELDPVAEQLLLDARERSSLGLGGRERATRWGSALAFLTVAALLYTGTASSRHLSPLLLTLLVGAYALASRIEFEVGSGFAPPTELVLVPMLFLLPAHVVPLAVVLGYLVGFVPAIATRRTPVERAVVAVSSCWHALGPTLVIMAIGEPAAGARGWLTLLLVLPAQYVADFASTAVTEWLALRVPPRELLRPMLWVFTVDALLAPVGLAAAAAATESRFGVLLPLPLLLLLRLFARQRQSGLDHVLELSTAYQGTAYLLGDVIEADDEYTGAHSREVVALTLAVCDRLRLDPRERRVAELTALLHDVGKIKIPSEIINKRGPLTDAERAVIDTHTIEGERLLLPVGGLLATVGSMVRSCHERYDGRGYPDGLRGEAIPLVARIVSCCDAYNAMTTDRPYRAAMPAATARAELAANRGAQFDPEVVDALLDTLEAEIHPFP